MRDPFPRPPTQPSPDGARTHRPTGSRGGGLARRSGLAATALLAFALVATIVGTDPRPAAAATAVPAGDVARPDVVATASVAMAAAAEKADLAAPAGYRVSGTITAAAGPVAGAVVTACPVSMAPQGGVPVECKGASTSASGAYSVTGLAPGAYVIRAAPPATAGSTAAAGYRGGSGYVASRAEAATLAVSADAAGIDLALPAGKSIAGKVTGAGGRPSWNTYVEACAADAPAGVACTGSYATTDGSFVIGGLGSGAFTLGFQAPSSGLASGYVGADGLTPLRSAARDIAAGTEGIAVTLPQGRSLAGSVSLEGAGPAGVNQVLVQACADESCVLGPSAWTVGGGTFQVGGLLPGTYTVSFSLPRTATHVSGFLGDGGYTPTRAAAMRLVIAGADVVGADAVLPRAAASLAGTASGGGSGLPLGVIVACGAGGTCLWTRTAADGSYTLALPSAGPWTVGLRAPGLYGAGLPGAYTAGVIVPSASPAMDGYLGGAGFTPLASGARAVVVGSPDRTRPQIVSRAPTAGAAGVSRTARVVVRFSEPVTGVSSRSFTLRDAATKKAVAATVVYDASSRTATLRPKTALPGGRSILVTLAGTIADLSGNRLPTATWAFTTKR